MQTQSLYERLYGGCKLHDINMCCGTTCDKVANLDYVKRLELAVDKLTTERNDLRVEAKFYKDLYYEVIGDIQKHYINLGKENKNKTTN